MFDCWRSQAKELSFLSLYVDLAIRKTLIVPSSFDLFLFVIMVENPGARQQTHSKTGTREICQRLWWSVSAWKTREFNCKFKCKLLKVLQISFHNLQMFIGAHDEKNPLNICTTSIYTLMLSMFLTILFTFFFCSGERISLLFCFFFFIEGYIYRMIVLFVTHTSRVDWI